MAFLWPKNMFVASYMITERIFELFCDHRFPDCYVITEHVFDLFCEYRTCLQLSSENKENLLLENQFTDVFWWCAFYAVWCAPHYENNIFHNQSVCNSSLLFCRNMCERGQPLRRAGHSFWGVLPSLCDLETSKRGGLVHIWSIVPQNRTKTVPGSFLPHQFQFIIHSILYSIR
jgi:hypothetical protein